MMLNLRHIIPRPIKRILRPLRRFFYRCSFWFRYGFWPPPEGTDMAGYDVLLDFIITRKIFELEGDVIEIGAFLGGGTYKLSKLAEKLAPTKRIFVVDIFDPNFDTTQCLLGTEMRELYRNALELHYSGLSQEQIFRWVTRSCKNTVVIKSDSKQVLLPMQKLCFAFIDGCHEPSYVKNDFYLDWERLVSGGVVAFDDYGFDLPQVTRTVDELIEVHRPEIKEIVSLGKKMIGLVRK